MSVLGKKWLIKNENKDKSVLEKILENRGLDKLTELEDFHDPFLFQDMEKAVSRIEKAIKTQERIIIFGDYDVDGITATAILVHTLKKLKANISFRLPHRVNDGYGLSEKFIDEFIEKEIKLLITVDCGISCYKEVQKAADHSIDVIITDHHTVPEQAPTGAFAILHPQHENPHYPFKELTGAGVAFKLAHALIQKNLPPEKQQEEIEALLDLASLGTIADLGSLTDENRLIVKRGLKAIKNTKWYGLKKIKELARIEDHHEVDTGKIGFQIAPRINAAGRIGDPYIALFLLLQEEGSEKALQLAQQLEELNQQRQKLTEQAIAEVEEEIAANHQLPYIIVMENSSWHAGILGLIAGRLVERYGRPAVILQELNETLIGSARSPEYFDVTEAITFCKEELINFGGHAQAAGLTIEKKNLQKFKEKISAYAQEKLQKMELKPALEIDCEVNSKDLNFTLAEAIENLQPFGNKNQKPTFLLKNLEPKFISQVGKDNNHLKFTTQFSNENVEIIGFRLGEFAENLRQQRKIDLVFHLNQKSWNNKISLELQALDFKFTEE